MATGLRPLQTALFAKLNAVPALAGRVYAVRPPESVPLPYVTLGSIFELPDDTHDAQGLNSMVTLHIWSKSTSNGEVYDLFAAVDAALDRVALTVTGFSEVQIKHSQHQMIEDPDPSIRHINAQYRIHMTKE
ncbi:DUF3168 domain-containing protein [Streptomyces sp. NPDC006235]|uniref:DUF3168 domain-containing protein n=1 Tax=Streptomyces sp. NPDC006235 TaxID=3156736 RepID=UPI0033B4A824